MPFDHVIPPQNKKQVSGATMVLIALPAVSAVAGAVSLVARVTGEESDPGELTDVREGGRDRLTGHLEGRAGSTVP